MNGISAGPKIASNTPHTNTDIIHALITSLRMSNTILFRRRIRWAASCHEERRLPKMQRGRNTHRLSPIRALAGSPGVATRAWWPRLCSMKKWP